MVVTSPVHSPVHGPVQSPESRFYSVPVYVHSYNVYIANPYELHIPLKHSLNAFDDLTRNTLSVTSRVDIDINII